MGTDFVVVVVSDPHIVSIVLSVFKLFLHINGEENRKENDL